MCYLLKDVPHHSVVSICAAGPNFQGHYEMKSQAFCMHIGTESVDEVVHLNAAWRVRPNKKRSTWGQRGGYCGSHSWWSWKNPLRQNNLWCGCVVFYCEIKSLILWYISIVTASTGLSQHSIGSESKSNGCGNWRGLLGIKGSIFLWKQTNEEFLFLLNHD